MWDAYCQPAIDNDTLTSHIRGEIRRQIERGAREIRGLPIARDHGCAGNEALAFLRFGIWKYSARESGHGVSRENAVRGDALAPQFNRHGFRKPHQTRFRGAVSGQESNAHLTAHG